jgi:hypothetical protein
MPRYANEEKAYYYRVTVAGRVAFPMDMMRYDRCYPANETESYKIAAAIRHDGDAYHKEPDGSIKVELVAVSRNPRWTPTQGRWESFGWKVIGCREST